MTAIRNPTTGTSGASDRQRQRERHDSAQSTHSVQPCHWGLTSLQRGVGDLTLQNGHLAWLFRCWVDANPVFACQPATHPPKQRIEQEAPSNGDDDVALDLRGTSRDRAPERAVHSRHQNKDDLENPTERHGDVDQHASQCRLD